MPPPSRSCATCCKTKASPISCIHSICTGCRLSRPALRCCVLSYVFEPRQIGVRRPTCIHTTSDVRVHPLDALVGVEGRRLRRHRTERLDRWARCSLHTRTDVHKIRSGGTLVAPEG
eukprot:2121879-Prymnesium_polylepis.1